MDNPPTNENANEERPLIPESELEEAYQFALSRLPMFTMSTSIYTWEPGDGTRYRFIALPLTEREKRSEGWEPNAPALLFGFVAGDRPLAVNSYGGSHVCSSYHSFLSRADVKDSYTAAFAHLLLCCILDKEPIHLSDNYHINVKAMTSIHVFAKAYRKFIGWDK